MNRNQEAPLWGTALDRDIVGWNKKLWMTISGMKSILINRIQFNTIKYDE